MQPIKMETKQAGREGEADDSGAPQTKSAENERSASEAGKTANFEDDDEENERSRLMDSDKTAEQEQSKRTNSEPSASSKGLVVNSTIDISRLNPSPESSLTYSPEDYKSKLLSLIGGDGVYNDCTVPYDIKASRDRFFRSGSRSRTPNSALDGHDDQESANLADETRINIKLEDEAGASKGKAANTGSKSTASGDMIQSINNLRQNVNNHIIGGSKNVMCRMRKLSINELKNGSSASRKYRVAFYGALLLLSVLFLYLIYQNLFNER